MRTFVVLAAFVACAYATPQVYVSGLSGLTLGGYTTLSHPALVSAPVHYAAPAFIAPAVTKTQYHAQDELGQASYGYAHPGQAHATVRDAFGNVRGSYAYINPEGKEVRVEYVADGAGFRVASNDLPVAPVAPAVPALIAPEPVQDTPEVKEAKDAHAKAVADAISRNAAAEKEDAEKPQSRRKRGIIAAPIALSAPTVHLASPAVTYAAIAGPTVHLASPAVTYSAIAGPAIVQAPVQHVRAATLTKTVLTPSHAVSYRVD